MGPFILGVLVGWLAEWMFYTFWVKSGKEDGDCSSIKAELELKNKQISSLQSQLASVSDDVTDNSISSTKALVNDDTNSADTKSTTKKAAAIAATSKTTPSKSAGAKSTATKSATKSATNKKSATKQKNSNTGDDFTKLSGIGPSMAAMLKSLGIDTFDKLAATDDDKLRVMLEESGAKMNNNKEAMDSWNEQATLAAKGNFKALKEMQATLKK